MSYKDLIAWQKAMDLVTCVYAVCRQLPDEERYALSDQLKRASVSVPSNIAEGHKRHGKVETARFASIALGSAAEVETQLILAQRLYDLDTSSEQLLAIEVQQLLSGLIRSLR